MKLEIIDHGTFKDIHDDSRHCFMRCYTIPRDDDLVSKFIRKDMPFYVHSLVNILMTEKFSKDETIKNICCLTDISINGNRGIKDIDEDLCNEFIKEFIKETDSDNLIIATTDSFLIESEPYTISGMATLHMKTSMFFEYAGFRCINSIMGSDYISCFLFLNEASKPVMEAITYLEGTPRKPCVLPTGYNLYFRYKGE